MRFAPEAENRSVLNDLLAELQQAKGGNFPAARYKSGVPGGSTVGPMYTGPGGLFGVLGLDQDIISTRITLRGLADALMAVPTMDAYPMFAYFTGFQADSGSEKNAVCDDAIVAGPGKSCIQTAQFGRYERATRTFEINRGGVRINRGEFSDVNIINDPLAGPEGPGLNGGGGSFTIPASARASANIAAEMKMRMMDVGVSFQNKLTRQLYQGNPSNNSAQDGYREFPGLDILIGTNKVDALTGTSCPSLASIIQNFNYAKLDGNGGNDIVLWTTYIMRALRHIADRTNLNPVNWVIAMRRELFYELTAVWPCSYLTSRCEFRTSNNEIRLNVDAKDQIDMRDSMRDGNYLMIDGDRIQVVIDDAIFEDTNTTSNRVTSGCFASDMYFIPTTYMGSRPATYWEYLDFRGLNGAMQEAADSQYLVGGQFWSDDGRFLWVKKPQNNWCVQLQAKIEPRVILRTPQLAARLQHVQYCPLLHTRDPFNNDPYFVNGGVSSARSAPSLYSDWHLP